MFVNGPCIVTVSFDAKTVIPLVPSNVISLPGAGTLNPVESLPTNLKPLPIPVR